MRIKSIQIDKLFDLFSYDIPLDNPENVSLITGPNGYGKTMILNIIFNLFNRNFEFFKTLVFEKITLKLEEGFNIEIYKILKNIKIEFKKSNESLGELDFDKIKEMEIDFFLKKQNIVTKYKTHEDTAKEFKNKLDSAIKNQKLDFAFDKISVHYIKDQRLLINVKDRNPFLSKLTSGKQVVDATFAISNDLKVEIANCIFNSDLKAKELDSNYIDRLIEETNEISENDYKNRIELLIIKQQKLFELGINKNELKVREYSKKDSKALLFFINDLEVKLKYFDELLEKIILFINILNSRLSYKTININNEKGIFALTTKGKELKLDQLSSGEIQQIILYYELIFKLTTNVLLLIDEPEISWHIVWQKEFLNDLITIAKLQNIQVIVATHAPAIVNGRWDLTSNLAEIAS